MTTDRENRLQEIRELHEASTSGEWYIVNKDKSGIFSTSLKARGIIYPPIAKCLRINGHKDAAFIVSAHRDIPWLLDEIERLERGTE